MTDVPLLDMFVFSDFERGNRNVAAGVQRREQPHDALGEMTPTEYLLA